MHCWKVNGTGEYNTKLNRPNSERQTSHIFSLTWNVWGDKMKVEGDYEGRRKIQSKGRE